ncbi:hypothetical protein [Bradyrhizobium erythrophlei]|uniref:Uncharacterized protein n=1 Tax=Bradyrhizobium erythrophlei TaxID=1437360 RepID=A0A1M5NRY7_9BRAD|nr:hypothetical protein [Bradyrhizobium erythrophlei]SHG92374.1 hypothetical protein SAMN05443248_3097 [Bradyrhizobium erythrophlei]
MDRQTIYAGQIPLETDQLKQSQNAMVGLAKLASAVLGSTTIVNAFTVTPTVPASLNVIVTPGEIYQLENLEASAWSSLSPDTHTILKQGVILDPVTLGITPPTTVGYSQVFLIEVQYQDLDTGSTVLPYFNANVPTVPFSGPGNAGSAQNTVRKGVASVQIKAGLAAPSGTQTAPTADAGWTGIYLVTVANGATTITSGNITPVSGAPFIPVTLPQVPAGVQSGQWLYGTDTGGVNAMVANVTPVPTTLTPGMTVHIRAANSNTGATTFNLNGLGASAVHRANGAALSAGDINAGMVVELIWDGSSWQIANYFGFTSSTVNNNTYTLSIPYAADSSGVANSIVVAPNPALTALTAGNELMVKLANTNTGATTITVNSLAAVSVVNPNGSALTAGQIVAGEMLWLLYDGTHFQVCNPSVATVNVYNLTNAPFADVSTFYGSGSVEAPYATHTFAPFTSATIGSQGNVAFSSGEIVIETAGRYLFAYSTDVYSVSGSDPYAALSSGWILWNGAVQSPSGNGLQIVNDSGPYIKEDYGGGCWIQSLSAGDTIAFAVYQVNGSSLTYDVGYGFNVTVTRVH